MTHRDSDPARIAALYDIHGNLPALEAMLEEIRGIGVDLIVIGGDVVAGPMPVETLRLLGEIETPIRWLCGNADREVLACMRGQPIDGVPERFREIVRWVAQQLGPEHERLIAGWPGTLRITRGERGEVLFCHATPRNDTDVFTRHTPEERLVPIMSAANVPLVVCGHTHMQFDRMIGSTRVVNAGSVGMPYGATGGHWLLLDPEPRHRRTPYDLGRAADRIRATLYPQAQEFADRHVLRPFSEDEVLAMFARVELT